MTADRIIVATIEAEADANGENGAAEAVYEFTRDLEFIRGGYGEQYWTMHRALEAQGVLDHSQSRCPDRDSPGQIKAWTPATGWQSVKARN